MALEDAIDGARHTGQRITWLDADGRPHNLTGVSAVSGTLRNTVTDAMRPIAGVLTPVAPLTKGVFTWAYAAGDLVPGTYEVEFTATYSDGLSDRTFVSAWTVRPALDED